MTEATLLIRGARILAGAAAQDTPLGDILIRGNTIVAVGEVPPQPPGSIAREIDGSGLLAAPGLINAHMHSQSGTMSGFADGLSHPAFMWLTQAHTSRRTPDEIRLAVLLCAAQMLTTGTTALIDHFPGQRFRTADMDAVLAAWEETGLRTTLAMRFFDGVFSDIIPAGIEVPASVTALVSGSGLLAPHPLAELREQMPDLITRWHGRSGRIGLCPAPSNPDRCSDEALLFCAELAQRHDLPIHTHLLETKAQARIARERYGESTVAHLERLGILSDRWSCAHAIWLDEADIALMAQHQAIAVHNPESNARIGTGRMRTPEMLAAGVPIALGTDGSGANDNLVMQEAMRAAALLHRSDLPDRRQWVTSRDALRMATVEGARALRLAGRLGEIAPGQLADIVLYRLDAPWWRPLNDAASQLVFAETGAAVTTAIVDGRVVLDRGRITTFDAPSVLDEIEAMEASLRARNADLFAAADAIAKAVP
ncbi:amidohydrolase family protein [Bosea sp. (in: a-proteobacteria)]|uniref:amidohydrolase family protein n=1 Tax=Bosea sp. (in: a-proteobacteria) TaxID=1871050 RepID=UPI0040333CA4